MRFRLQPTAAQEAALLEHCSHARFVWNMAVEQHQHWRPGRASAPGYVEQSRQLTEARRQFGWLAAGSQMVQQQALRDFAQAMANFFAGTHRRPTWRKAGRNDGFRVVAVKPRPILAPGNDLAVGIDRGVVVSAALSTGELLHTPGLTAKERKRLHHLERRLARAGRGSNRRNRLRLAIARMRARETDRRKDWAEKASTDIA